MTTKKIEKKKNETKNDQNETHKTENNKCNSSFLQQKVSVCKE